MRATEFYRPKTVEDALALLAKTKNPKLLAGGTDLIIALNQRQVNPNALVDISGIKELCNIYEEKDVLHIGAGATFTQMQYSPLVAKYCPALCHAASQMGAVQVRNIATIGGNVANAATAADALPPLFAMEAKALIKSPKGQRILPVANVVTGINQTCLAQDEIISEFLIEAKPGAAKVFEKIGRRKALAISRINLCICAKISEDKVDFARVAVGAVGKTCYRVTELEEFLQGKTLCEENIANAANLMDQVVARNLAGRSTTPYKRKIAFAVLKKGLQRIAGGEGT